MKEKSRKIRMPRARKPAHPAVPALEWLEDAAGRAVRVTATGSRRILAENHTGVLQYTDESVCLTTRRGFLRVHGQNLALREVRENALIIYGNIRSVELPDEGGAE